MGEKGGVSRWWGERGSGGLFPGVQKEKLGGGLSSTGGKEIGGGPVSCVQEGKGA